MESSRLQVFKRKIKAYIPDFKLAFEHVCIHTGGRGVVEEIEKQLSMTPTLMQPSKDTLYRYGNTSSSSIWYPPARYFPSPALSRKPEAETAPPQAGFSAEFMSTTWLGKELESFL